jgi:hypothetical protein
LSADGLKRRVMASVRGRNAHPIMEEEALHEPARRIGFLPASFSSTLPKVLETTMKQQPPPVNGQGF